MPFECSLLIPCRNAARFLPALFEGIAAQKMSFAEVILWDDASTDDSAAMACRFGARVIRSDTAVGPATARNQLVRAARHAWIHLHDADDLIMPDYLAELSRHALPGIDVVACDADWIDAGTRERVIAWRYSQSDYAAAPVPYLLTHALGINNCLYRRESFLSAGGYRPEFVPWEDADYHVRLAASGCRFHFVPRVLTQSVRHAAGISMDYSRNWNTRVRCLADYVSLIAPWLHPLIAAEAERAAAELALLNDSGAAAAIALCQTLGGDPPTSRHPLLRLAKAVVPAETLLRIQHRQRRS